MMKKSHLIEARRRKVNPKIRHMVDLSFKIVDRIHEILKAKGLKQKDLALRAGKERVRNQQMDARILTTLASIS